jgi:hypothetical protein
LIINTPGSSNNKTGEDKSKRRILLASLAIIALLSLFVILGNPGWFVPQNSNLPTESNKDVVNVSDSVNLEETHATIDSDGDGIPDAIDNCPDVPNSRQADVDHNGIGDICDVRPSGNGGNGGSTATSPNTNDSGRGSGNVVSSGGGGGGGGGATSSTTVLGGGSGDSSYTTVVSSGGGGGGGGGGGSSVPSNSAPPPKVNHPPIANGKSVTTDEDTSVLVTLTASDEDGNSFTYTISSVPKNGTLSTIDVDKVTYTPNSNFNGNDSFTFRAFDGQAYSNNATISIKVNSVNDAPVAPDFNMTTDEDTPIDIKVVTSASDLDGDVLTVMIPQEPINGTAVLKSDNTTITYTPHLNFHGTDSFQYLLSDGASNATGFVHVTINSVNDPPVLNGTDISASVDEDKSVTIDVLAHFSDPDNDPISITGVTQPPQGTVVNNGNGTVTFTPSSNYNGQESFDVTVSDGNGGNTTATVIVTVNPVPDAPVISGNLSHITVNEDSSVVIAILANAYDPDGDSISLTSVTQPSHGTVLVNGDGTVTYTPNANYNGPDAFDFTISDSTGLTTSGTVQIQVNAVNDAPVTSAESITTNEETPVQVTLDATDADNDTLTFAIISQPEHGMVSILGNVATYTPATDYFGSDSFTFQANDGLANSNISTVTITVINVNDAPAANDDYVAFHGWNPVTIAVLANDVDADRDSLSITGTTAPSHGSTVVNADNTITYTPENGYAGLDSFTYAISDGNGGTASATVHLAVNVDNNAPVTSDTSATTNEETPVQIRLQATDADNDTLTFAIISQPAHGTVSISSGNVATYTPSTDYFGTDSFTFQANDGVANSNISAVTITVVSVNDAPVAHNDLFDTNEDTALSANVLANDVDVDGDVLHVVSHTVSANGTLDMNDNGTFTYTPNQNFHGTDSFQYTVSDGNGGTSTATVTITIISIDDVPVANDDHAYTTLSNPVWVNVLANDVDVDGDVLHVTSVGSTPDGTAAIVNGGMAVVFTPNDGFAGNTHFTYSVSDGTLTSTGTVFVHVYPYRFGHIQSPVGDGDHQFQQGDTANIRFKLTDQNDNEITNATVILQIQQVDASNNPIGPLMNATSSGGSNDGNYFRYSTSAKLYQYNLKTDTMAPGKWALYVYLIDSSMQPPTYILLENAPIDGISTTIFIK